MGDVVLRYRSFADVDDLAVGECTVHACAGINGGPSFWHVWMRVQRDTDGVSEAFCVPIAPRGPYTENGPGGKTWGLSDFGGGTWQISPSINVLDTRELHPGEHETIGSLWHHTPGIVGVSDGERWATGAAP